jgi:hypothetical protein
VPAAQTVEGGVQLRLTGLGFDKVAANATPYVSGVVEDADWCIPRAQSTYYEYCYLNDGPCTSSCEVHDAVDSVDIRIVGQVIRLTLTMSGFADVPFRLRPPFSGSCVAHVVFDQASVTLDLRAGIDPASGELAFSVENTTFDVQDFQATNCGIISDLATVMVSAFEASGTLFADPRLPRPGGRSRAATRIEKPAGRRGVPRSPRRAWRRRGRLGGRPATAPCTRAASSRERPAPSRWSGFASARGRTPDRPARFRLRPAAARPRTG